MKWLFIGIIGVFLIVIQTVLLPFFSQSFHCFDLMIIVIVHISLHFSHYRFVAAIALIGGIMDSLSGGPFFLYTFSYIWIFLIVQLIRQLVFQTSVLFVVVISLMSVTIQQGLFLFSVFARQEPPGIGAMEISLMIQQVAWGSVLIPMGVGAISTGYRRWRQMVRRMIAIREQKRI